MSSPMTSEIEVPNFPATDPNSATQDEEQQEQLREDQNPKKSPNSITLEIPDAVADDPNPDDAAEITPSSPAAADFRESSSTFSLTFSRRGGGKRRKRNALQEKKYLKRCESLARLNLIPFVPAKSLDLSSHEALLRRLGLWDFAHLDFDFKLRRDLILQLIASFSPAHRYSTVNEVRIKVTRPDLGRALCLPVKKGKVESASEEKESEESVSFVEEFVSNFILLHDDTWMMSDDVMSTMKLIREGNFEKVDFSMLIWTMVEKELNNTELGDCYYASHLQLLIKSQREGLLKEDEPNKMEIDLKQEDQEVEAEEEEGVKMSQELHGKPDLEEQNIELSLGGMDNAVKDDVVEELMDNAVIDDVVEELMDNAVKDDVVKERMDNTVKDDVVKENQEQEQLNDEEDAMDFEESKEVEIEERQWYNNSMDGHFLQQCNLGGVESAEFEEIKEEEEEDDREEEEEEEEENDEEEGKEGEYEEKEEEEDEMAFGISPKGFALEGTDSENLIEAIEASQNPFSSALQSRNFFAPKVDNMQAVPGTSGLFNNGNGSKRAMGDFDNEMSHESTLNGGNKRMRSDEHWDTMKSISEFDIYMDQMQHIMGKARMLQNAKDQELQNLSVQNQMLLNELENRTNIYQHNLAKAKMEENHKRQVETYRYEHELHMMGKLLEGYRKALKDTTRAFAEYRKKVSLREEPIYKDAGSGGLVLSTGDMEKLRLKREEEERQNRLLIERMINEFEAGWVAKIEECDTVVELMSNRLLDVEKGVNFCKEKVEKSKESLLSGFAPSEEQQGTQTTV